MQEWGEGERMEGKGWGRGKFELVPNKFLLSPAVREGCRQVTKHFIVTFANDFKHDMTEKSQGQSFYTDIL